MASCHYVLFEEDQPWDKLDSQRCFFSPESQRSPYRFQLLPQSLVVILFDESDVLYRFYACCHTLGPPVTETLGVLMYNTHAEHTVTIAQSMPLTTVLQQPHLSYRRILLTHHELATLKKQGSMPPALPLSDVD